MITVKPYSPQIDTWQNQWRNSIRDPHELLESLGLQGFERLLSAQAEQQFNLRVPRCFVAKMRYGDINDPLLRQVLPVLNEQIHAPGFSADAVGDMASQQKIGLLHKYHGRALLITTGACAINCRYCFRRHFPYAEQTATTNLWQQAIEYLANDESITELLLSGGDPLSLSTEKLKRLCEQLKSIKHIKRLRFHTRLPVVLPARIDDEFVKWLANLPFQCIFVIHANHPNELDDAFGAAIHQLKQAGATVLNQSVLLKGVNDDAEVLIQLSERLFTYGVLPYYLHSLDKVLGAAHFEVTIEHAQELLAELMKRLPGYLVPKLVQEIAGQTHKTPII